MAITYSLSIHRLAWYNDGHAIKLNHSYYTQEQVVNEKSTWQTTTVNPSHLYQDCYCFDKMH